MALVMRINAPVACLHAAQSPEHRMSHSKSHLLREPLARHAPFQRINKPRPCRLSGSSAASSASAGPTETSSDASTVLGATGWAAFAAAASGEYSGIAVTYNSHFEAQEVPYQYVPDAFREWGQVPKDWHTQCSCLADGEGMLTKLKWLMPIVGCEEEAVAFPGGGTPFILAESRYMSIVVCQQRSALRRTLQAVTRRGDKERTDRQHAPRHVLSRSPDLLRQSVLASKRSAAGCEADAVAFNEDSRRALRSEPQHRQEPKTVLPDGSYSTGPRLLRDLTTARVEHCLADAASRRRTRLVFNLKRGDSGDAWRLATLEQHVEARERDYDGGAELAACGYAMSPITETPLLEAAALQGRWRIASSAAFELDGTDGLRVSDAAAPETLGIPADRVLLHSGAWCAFSSGDTGEATLTAGWVISKQECRVVSRTFSGDRMTGMTFLTAIKQQ